MRETNETDEEQLTVLLRPRRARPRWRVGAGAAVVLVVVAAVVAVLLAGARAGGHERTLEPAVATSEPAAAESLYVHVAGEVATPGLYLLSPGARVADALAAAGGFRESAERAAVNLARRVVDGEQIIVPAIGTAPAAGAAAPGSAVAGSAAGSVLSLSVATAAQLEELPEIGPSTAAKIVAYREANGPFTSVDQLLEVPGIGEKTLAAFRDQVAP